MMHRIRVDGTEIKNRKHTNLVPIYVDVCVFIQHNSSTIVEKVSENVDIANFALKS